MQRVAAATPAKNYRFNAARRRQNTIAYATYGGRRERDTAREFTDSKRKNPPYNIQSYSLLGLFLVVLIYLLIWKKNVESALIAQQPI